MRDLTLIKASCSGHRTLIRVAEDCPVDTTRRPTDDLLDVARALMLLQGAILIATTIEALVWANVFPGASGAPALMSGASAVVILIGRIRLRADRRRARRLVYMVEGLILLTAAVNVAIGLVLAHALPPMVALLTQVVLPISVIALLRRSARVPRATAVLAGAVLERAS
jgi:hypothetical protein